MYNRRFAKSSGSAGAVHAHHRVQNPLSAIRQNPFLFLQVPAALHRFGRPHADDKAHLRALQRARDQILKDRDELPLRDLRVHVDSEAAV
jgi:hypothetical protein